jgi:hypothetical protein
MSALKSLEDLVILVTRECFGAMLGDLSHVRLVLRRTFDPVHELGRYL